MLQITMANEKSKKKKSCGIIVVMKLKRIINMGKFQKKLNNNITDKLC